MARVTVEDCLEHVDDRFSLVHLAAQRAKQLKKGVSPFVKCDNREVVTALREIAEGLVMKSTGAVPAEESAAAETGDEKVKEVSNG